MSKDRVYIEEILQVILELEAFALDLTYEAFVANRMAYRAFERNFEIIGEAVKRLSLELKAKYPEVPWRDIAGFRDVLIHEYAAVNALTVWESFEQDIPQLKATLLNAAKEIN